MVPVKSKSHKRFGRVVPEVASRHQYGSHHQHRKALEEAGMQADVTTVAVTYSPGLQLTQSACRACCAIILGPLRLSQRKIKLFACVPPASLRQ